MVSEVRERAKELLCRFITKKQSKDFLALKHFTQKDTKGRLWTFYNRPHYPIECEGKHICIDGAPGAPLEDVLLQVWLEVIAGRDDAVCRRKKAIGGVGSGGDPGFPPGFRVGTTVELTVLWGGEDIPQLWLELPGDRMLAAIRTTQGETLCRFEGYIVAIEYSIGSLGPAEMELTMEVGNVVYLTNHISSGRTAYVFQTVDYYLPILTWHISRHYDPPPESLRDFI